MSEAQAFLSSGDLYIQRQDPISLAWGPELGPFEAEKFEYKPKFEKKEKTSKGRGRYGQIIATVFVPQAPEFSVTLGQVNREFLPLALMGTSEVINQAAGTWADEEIEITDVGGNIHLPKMNVAKSGFVVKSEDGDVTYEYEKHYVVNWGMGWLTILDADGAPSKGDVVKISGSYGALGGTRISASKINQLRARFILHGQNLVDGTSFVATALQVAMSSDQGLDLLSDDFASIPLTGSAETPVGYDTPFVLETFDNFAG